VTVILLPDDCQPEKKLRTLTI